MVDISLVSRVRTRRNNSKKHDKNSKNTTRRATSAIKRISSELNNPKRAPSKVNLTSMEVACFSFVFKLGNIKKATKVLIVGERKQARIK